MNLSINRVKFRNFLSYGHKWQDVILFPGINAIIGKDDKNRSNGSGKSSFVETITFALYGKTNKGLKKENLVNWKNKKNLIVELYFNVDDIDYKIVRGIKPDKFEIYKNNELIPQASDVREYQKFLEEEIIKYDFNTIKNLIYTNLNSIIPILKQSTPQKRKFLETIFDLEFYQTLNKKNDEKIKEYNDILYKNTINNDSNARSYEDLIEQRDKLVDKLNNLTVENDNNQLISLNNELLLLENKKFDLKESSDVVLLVKNEINKLESSIKGLQDKINYISKDIDNSLDEKLKQLEQYEKSLKKINLTSLNMKLEQISEIRNKVKDAITVLNNKISNYQIELTKFETEKKIKQKNLSLIENKNSCPICTRPFENNSIVKQYYKDIDEYDSCIDNFSLEIVRCREKIFELEGKISEYDKLEEKVNKNITLHNNLTIKICSLGDIRNEIEENSNKLKQIDDLKKQVISENILLEKRNDELKLFLEDEKKNQLIKDEYDKNVKKINDIKLEIIKLNASISFKNEQIDDVKKSIGEIETKIKDNDKKRNFYIKEKNEITDLLDYNSVIKSLLKDENIKQYAISYIMPYLTDRTNYYLSEAGCNFYVKFTDWLDIEIIGSGIDKCTYENLSGGEARSVDLALQLAFLEISKLQNNITIDTIVFDELLDSSIDSSGIEMLINICKKVCYENNYKLFVVTHRQEVSGFDNIYSVEKKEGYSTIIF